MVAVPIKGYCGSGIFTTHSGSECRSFDCVPEANNCEIVQLISGVKVQVCNCVVCQMVSGVCKIIG